MYAYETRKFIYCKQYVGIVNILYLSESIHVPGKGTTCKTSSHENSYRYTYTCIDDSVITMCRMSRTCSVDDVRVLACRKFYAFYALQQCTLQKKFNTFCMVLYYVVMNVVHTFTDQYLKSITRLCKKHVQGCSEFSEIPQNMKIMFFRNRENFGKFREIPEIPGKSRKIPGKSRGKIRGFF